VQGYDLEDYAADIEAVRAHLGLERLDLLGHSHGGFVAMAWASAYPGSVGRLVLSNTAARFTDTIREARMAGAMAFAQEPWFADAVAAATQHQRGEYANDEELGALLEREAPLLFGAWGEDEQAMALQLKAAGMNADALRHFNEHVAGGMDMRAGLAGVDAPVLVITGELDPFGESTAREIADALPRAKLVLVPGARHFTFGESANRGVWARAVLDFLAAA
jgi:pimeloyl-ACP methyl ester carboxylesterase